MRAPSGEEYWNVGAYKEIIVPERIVSVMHFSDKDGSVLPASHYFGPSDFPNEMIDMVTFEVLDNIKTKLTLSRNHSADLANKFGEIQGWNPSLDRFTEALER